MGLCLPAAGSGKMAAAVLLALGLRCARRTLAAAGPRGAQVRSSQRDKGSCRHWCIPGQARVSCIPLEPLPLPRVKFRDCARRSARESDLAATASRNSRGIPVGTERVLLARRLLQAVSAVHSAGNESFLGASRRSSDLWPLVCTSFALSSSTLYTSDLNDPTVCLQCNALILAFSEPVQTEIFLPPKGSHRAEFT